MQQFLFLAIILRVLWMRQKIQDAVERTFLSQTSKRLEDESRTERRMSDRRRAGVTQEEEDAGTLKFGPGIVSIGLHSSTGQPDLDHLLRTHAKVQNSKTPTACL